MKAASPCEIVAGRPVRDSAVDTVACGTSAIGTAGTLPAMRAICPSHVTQTPPVSAADRLSAWPSSSTPAEELLGIGLAAEKKDRAGNEPQRDHGRAD